MARLEPVHPGEILKHDFMEPFGLSSTALAEAIGVTQYGPTRLCAVAKRESVDALKAIRPIETA